jgi:hypothetical protein
MEVSSRGFFVQVLEWVKSDPGTVQRATPANLAANRGGNKIASQLSACSGLRDNDFAIRPVSHPQGNRPRDTSAQAAPNIQVQRCILGVALGRF